MTHLTHTAMPYTTGGVAEIVSLSLYESQVTALLDDEERISMEFYIATTAADHPVIPKSGGFRKVRWARRHQGKSGGFRVIYFFVASPGREYMASIYAKSAKETLSAEDLRILSKLAQQIRTATKADH
jgi:hypothetical protein